MSCSQCSIVYLDLVSCGVAGNGWWISEFSHQVTFCHHHETPQERLPSLKWWNLPGIGLWFSCFNGWWKLANGVTVPTDPHILCDPNGAPLGCHEKTKEGDRQFLTLVKRLFMVGIYMHRSLLTTTMRFHSIPLSGGSGFGNRTIPSVRKAVEFGKCWTHTSVQSVKGRVLELDVRCV